MSHFVGDVQKRVSAATPAQLRANRRNAKRSTGPRSTEGKRRAARNAITHGMYCRDLILPGESRREFLALRLGFHCDLKATDAVEFAIIERAVIAQWHLKRSQAAEADLHANRAHAVDRRARRQVAKIQSELGDAASDWTEEDRQTRADAQPRIAILMSIKASRVPAATTLAVDFASGDGGLERLARHEHRLEHHFYKALRELRLHRKDKRDNGIRSTDARPYVDVHSMTEELLACGPKLREVEREDTCEGEGTCEGDDACETGGEPGCDKEDQARWVRHENEPLPQGRAGSSSDVQNEPNVAAPHAACDAAEGCGRSFGEEAGQMPPLVMHPHPIAVSMTRHARDGSD